ncbi:MAG: HD domain-containing protein [Anaerolineaceae bacterium]|nr:MAG: HD domain-containing protein [Anaerolineaceae bacterium]
MITEFFLQNLPDSNQKLDAIFHVFNDLLFILDVDGTILDYKAGDTSHLYSSPEKFLRRKIQDILPPEVGGKIEDGLNKLQAGSKVGSIEYFLHTPAGKCWYESRLVLLSNGQCAMLVRDITKYKISEIKIKRQFDQLAALRSIDLAISSDLDLTPTLSVILDHVRTQLNIDAADILLFDPHTQLLEFAAGTGFKTSALQHTRLRVGEEYAGKAVLDRKVFHIPYLKSRQTAFLRSPFWAEEKFVAYYALPLIAKGEVVGVLEIFHRALLDGDDDWLNYMEMLAGQAAIAIDNSMLFKKLQLSNAELTLAYDKTIEGWSHALDLRDKETEGHSRRVTAMTFKLASQMGIKQPELAHICRGAMLHDIGKVAIPDDILHKPGPLSEEEWIIMRRHPLIAMELLAPIDYLVPALDIPRSHHEKWNGTGYPDRLAGEEIPLAARLFAIVDVYDALTSDRPYRRAWSQRDALDYILEQSGKHFDPSIVPVFIDMVAK